MVKRHHVLAIVAYLLIPAATVLGGMLFSAIDPEIAAKTSDYVRNFRLLSLAKHSILFAMLLVNMGLWLLTCLFVVKSRNQPYGWLFLAAFGPFGFIVLTMLRDNAPAPGDTYRRFVDQLKIPLRVAYELGIFVAVWVTAFQAMLVKRDLMIMYGAATTGMSKAEIINEQNASSGMWAFSEGLEVLYLVVLFYLLWPVAFNLGGRLARSWAASRRA